MGVGMHWHGHGQLIVVTLPYKSHGPSRESPRAPEVHGHGQLPVPVPNACNYCSPTTAEPPEEGSAMDMEQPPRGGIPGDEENDRDKREAGLLRSQQRAGSGKRRLRVRARHRNDARRQTCGICEPYAVTRRAQLCANRKGNAGSEVWTRKFHHYTYGRPVTVVTDHKLLVSIRKKPLAKAPKMLQNMLLNTQKYTYDLVFKPGAEIPAADAMSRALLKEMGQESEPVHAVYAALFKQERLYEIRGATEKDATLQQLRTIIMAGWPADKSALPETAKPYFNYRDELSVHDGIIVRGDRVVIPKTMRQDLLVKVHAGHSGINSCLRRARDSSSGQGCPTTSESVEK